MSVAAGDRPLVSARGVTRVLPERVPVTLVHDIDLDIRAGEFIAITGPSGSGKSSLLYLLGLLDVPTRGEIEVFGRPTAAMPETERAGVRLAGLGFIFQFHFLLPEFTALANVTLPMRALGRLTRAEIDRRGTDLLVSLGLEDHIHKRPDQLSGGQRQRVAVARALANDPAIIFADEPTGSLDSKATGQVFDILRALVDRERRTIVAVTHDVGLAARMDRRVHIVDGAIVSDEAIPAPAQAATDAP